MSDLSLVLYHGLASTCSKKVRLCLYEKQLPFASRLLDLQKFEQHAPEYLAINPNGVVPSLVHNGHSIIELSVIVEYLDDTFPDRPLKPANTYDRATMRLWLKYSDDVAYKAVYVPTWHHFRARAEEGLSKDEIANTLSKIPTKERRERWDRMALGGYSESELQDAYEAMRKCLAYVDQGVARTKWLAGATYSLADLAILPFIHRIRNLRPDLFSPAAHQHLVDWYERSRERPAFAKAIDFADDPRAKELPNL